MDTAKDEKSTLERLRDPINEERNAELRAALQDDSFVLYLQLIYSVKTGTFCDAEALVRMKHPERGIIPPSCFIRDLLECGLVGELDYLVLDKVCALLESWKGSDLEEMSLSCNFSRATISEKNFLNRFNKIVKRYDFDHSRLILELTEDAMEGDYETALSNIKSCKRHGFRTALDDLGAGFTSLLDLCDYPVDRIKIDRSIIRKTNTTHGHRVLKEVVHLAHNLGISVLCEGIENETERTIAEDCGCDYIQGFYFSQALPVEKAEACYRRSKIAPFI